MGRQRVEIGCPIAFHTPDGGTLTGENVRISAETSGEYLLDVEISLDLAHVDWARVDAGGWFRMPPEDRGPMSEPFESARPVEIEARLRPEVLSRLAEGTKTVEALRDAILRGIPEDLRRTESWTGMYVTQERTPNVKRGFLTRASELGANVRFGAPSPRSSPVLLDALRAHFTRRNLIFEVLEELSALRLLVEGNHSPYVCIAQTDEEVRQIYVHCVYPNDVPEPIRPAVAELLVRINHFQKIGNFDLDWSTGRLRYKTTHDVADGPLTETMIEDLVGYGLIAVEQHHATFADVIVRGVSPLDAIAAAEDRRK